MNGAMNGNDRLDHALGVWGQADFSTLAGDSAAARRIMEHASRISATPSMPASPASPRHRRHHRARWRAGWWAGGAAVAASLVAVLMLGTPLQQMLPRPGGTAPSGLLAEDDSDVLMSFAMLYTPTSEEEYLL